MAQADFLLGYLGPLAASVPVMLDIEFNPYSGGLCYGLRGSRMATWVARFSAEVRARTGRAPYIYTPQGWWNPCTGGSAALHKSPLWVPNYTTAASPAMPGGWPRGRSGSTPAPGLSPGSMTPASPTWTGCSAALPRSAPDPLARVTPVPVTALLPAIPLLRRFGRLAVKRSPLAYDRGLPGEETSCRCALIAG